MSAINFYEPFYPLDRLIDELMDTQPRGKGHPNKSSHRLTDSGDNTQNSVQSLKPRMDLHENTDKNMVTAMFELPGMKKDDVQIDVNNNRLTISGESKLDEEHKEGNYVVKERRMGKFSRTLQLPQGVKNEQIKANLHDGVLTVTFPKAGSEENAPKKISID